MTSKNIEAILDNGLLTVTLNRPAQRNPLSLADLHQMQEIFTTFADNPVLKVAVITGAGNKSFSAGGDLQDCNERRSTAEAQHFGQCGRAALDAIRFFPLPTVAALNGPALGGGAELAMACDFRVAASQAGIGFIHKQLNVVPQWGGNVDLIECLGASKALHLMLDGQIIDVNQAHDIGLVNACSRPDQTLQQCLTGFLRPLLELPTHLLRGFKAPIIEHRRDLHQRYATVTGDWAATTWAHAKHWRAHDQRLHRLNRDAKEEKR